MESNDAASDDGGCDEEITMLELTTSELRNDQSSVQERLATNFLFSQNATFETCIFTSTLPLESGLQFVICFHLFTIPKSLQTSQKIWPIAAGPDGETRAARHQGAGEAQVGPGRHQEAPEAE